jgi:hypothetical protein
MGELHYVITSTNWGHFSLFGTYLAILETFFHNMGAGVAISILLWAEARGIAEQSSMQTIAPHNKNSPSVKYQ